MWIPRFDRILLGKVSQFWHPMHLHPSKLYDRLTPFRYFLIFHNALNLFNASHIQCG